MKELKEFWSKLNKVYFFNFIAIATVLFSIFVAFSIQFKVESLQEEMAETQAQILTYKDQISLLEVEWTYLTRPERLRTLASRYLKDNGYTLASQIKGSESMEKYYSLAAQNSEEQVVMNDVKVSF